MTMNWGNNTTCSSSSTGTIHFLWATSTGGLDTFQVDVGFLSTTDGATTTSIPVVEEESRAREEAKQKAAAMLRKYLTEEQEQELDQEGWFEAIGSRGGRYRVYYGFSRNVICVQGLSESSVRQADFERFCLHPTGQTWETYPEGDVMLAQKLLLETDEDTFRELANISHINQLPKSISLPESMRRAS